MFTRLTRVFYPTNSPQSSSADPPHHRGYTLGRKRWPSIRLSLSHGVPVQLYGYPTDLNNEPESHYLSITEPPLAYLLYILGPDWRSQVSVPQQDGSRNKIERHRELGEYTSIPLSSHDNEADICLRMRRCGALSVDQSDHQTSIELRDREIEDIERQIFGWPSTGSVWILRISPLGLRPDPKDFGTEERMLAQVDSLKQEEDKNSEKNRVEALREGIARQENMQGICGLLERAGAKYYKHLEDCPEVISLGLIGPDAQTDLSPAP